MSSAASRCIEFLGLLLLALPFRFVRLLGRRLLLVVVLGILGVRVRFARQAERGQELLHQPGVGALIEERVGQPVEVGAGLLLDEAAPEFGQAPRAGRRRKAGQPLARQHGDGVLERRLLARARLGEGAAMIAVVEHRGQVRGDALHPAGPDRLDPRLLDRVEQRPRRGVLRRVPAVDRVVVAGEPQREGIGEPAKDGGLARIGLARRLGQPGLRPLRPGHQRGLVGGKGDLELRMARHARGCTTRAPA